MFKKKKSDVLYLVEKYILGFIRSLSPILKTFICFEIRVNTNITCVRITSKFYKIVHTFLMRFCIKALRSLDLIRNDSISSSVNPWKVDTS